MRILIILLIATYAISAEFRQDSTELRLIVKDDSSEALNIIAESISKKIGIEVASIKIAELGNGNSNKEKLKMIIIKSRNVININEKIPGILKTELQGYFYWESVKVYKDNVLLISE